MEPKKKSARMRFIPRVYCGELSYWDDEEQIDVSRFIVRKNEIAFDLITEWDLGGHWSFNGIAKRVRGEKYVAERVIGIEMVGQRKEDESIPFHFEFTIEKQSDQRIQISGKWFAGGETHVFSGTLKRYRT